jgi:hypothetical protein
LGKIIKEYISHTRLEKSKRQDGRGKKVSYTDIQTNTIALTLYLPREGGRKSDKK